jgi:hypothetical protein
MRMRVCYQDCHEAGLCCYIVVYIEKPLATLLLPIVTFYTAASCCTVYSELPLALLTVPMQLRQYCIKHG